MPRRQNFTAIGYVKQLHYKRILYCSILEPLGKRQFCNKLLFADISKFNANIDDIIGFVYVFINDFKFNFLNAKAVKLILKSSKAF